MNRNSFVRCPRWKFLITVQQRCSFLVIRLAAVVVGAASASVDTVVVAADVAAASASQEGFCMVEGHEDRLLLRWAPEALDEAAIAPPQRSSRRRRYTRRNRSEVTKRSLKELETDV